MSASAIAHPLMTLEEAQILDQRIVTNSINLLRDLLNMYHGEGYGQLGHPDWGSYLETVSDRAGVKAKALRRWTKAALLEDGSGHELGTFSEGTIRPIIDTLSTRKGFTDYDREAALELAIEFVDGEQKDVTGVITQAAAYYIATTSNTPEAGTELVERLKSGEITASAAYTISGIMKDDAAAGIEHILAQTNDPDLAGFMVGLKSNEIYKWEDIQETIELSGCIPTDNGQVPIGQATRDHLVDYLNAPQKMKRYEMAVERSEALKEVAKLAADVFTRYWGIHPEVPENMGSMQTESELYQLLIDLGYIKYGAK